MDLPSLLQDGKAVANDKCVATGYGTIFLTQAKRLKIKPVPQQFWQMFSSKH
jgi:hypothetical protein